MDLNASAEERIQKGLHDIFEEHFPITDTRENFVLEYLGYSLEPPKYSVQECKERGLTYSVSLKVKLLLYCTDPENEDFERVEQEVYLGNVPYITKTGSFVFNGAERVVVSQLHRSPGVFFSQSVHPNGTKLYSARIIPFKGAWIEFATDIKNVMYAYIDRKKKFPVTTLLRAIGFSSDKDILEIFDLAEEVAINKKSIKKYIGRKLAARVLSTWVEDFVDEDTGEVVSITRNEVLLDRDHILTEEDVEVVLDSGQESLILMTDKENASEYSIIYNTLQKDNSNTEKEAVELIYRQLRNVEAPDEETARGIIEKLFFSDKRYDLGEVGRYRLNKKLHESLDEDSRVLTKKDIIRIIQYLIQLLNAKINVDDIDHLSNRRVRTVGEQLQSQFSVGLSRMARTIRERMNIRDNEVFTPSELINTRTLASVLNSFFGTNQLSQFKDQTNLLAELTHKRRISALGPGGLSRERAGFEVRDVHYTHYGRLCPIETPEGPNIGLINSLCVYAKVNGMGFIETPYRRVINGIVSKDIDYMSAEEEDEKVIAQSNAPIDDNGNYLEEKVATRKMGDFPVVLPEEIDYMDVAPNQIVSLAASLIPFLDHNDANRALMGSNMQRQAVPLIWTEAPMVGTGMEAIAGHDAWESVKAKRAGRVEKVDARNIYIIGEDSNGVFIDHYALEKNIRTNQNTAFHQIPIVKEGQEVAADEVIADGPSIDKGELALGKNILVAFMPWNGYNYEDAIILSQKLIREDTFTSLHIYEKEIEARELKHGTEEITRALPNVREDELTHLDESGIVKVGTYVKPGMILVGKVSPKGEIKPTPEERLLRAIFGDKAGHVVNKSLYTPASMEGVVVDVKIFTKKGYQRDARATRAYEEEKARLEKAHHDSLLMIDKEEVLQIIDYLSKQELETDAMIDDALYKAGSRVPKEAIEGVNRFALRSLVKSYPKEVQQKYDQLKNSFLKEKKQLKLEHEEKLSILDKDDILPNGVTKVVKVYVATKRKMKVGDKMAGRHGNKGIVSNIVPEIDMPYMEDGTPVDLILNPLGVPSRMNIGQILEVHLGLIGKKLGKQIEDIFKEKQGDFIAKLRQKMQEIANTAKLMKAKAELETMSDEELLDYARDWSKGVKFAVTPFESVNNEEFAKLFELAKMDADGKMTLFDGKTGERIKERVNVGYMYMLKLHHLVDEKMHARSTGPYSLVTQQPVGGKALFGGQRFGEMEVWALEAYGASHTLKEMLTIKSDDVEGRAKAYRAITRGDSVPESGIPETMFVLTRELQALGLDVELYTKKEEAEDE